MHYKGNNRSLFFLLILPCYCCFANDFIMSIIFREPYRWADRLKKPQPRLHTHQCKKNSCLRPTKVTNVKSYRISKSHRVTNCLNHNSSLQLRKMYWYSIYFSRCFHPSLFTLPLKSSPSPYLFYIYCQWKKKFLFDHPLPLKQWSQSCSSVNPFIV